MSIPADLLDDLRALAKKYGSLVLIEGCAELVRQFAVRGMRAELAEKSNSKEACPRCRARDAAMAEAREVLKRTRSNHPQGRSGEEEQS